MGDKNYVSAALLEHRFWLQILGDHARFLYHSLSPSEKGEIERATLSEGFGTLPVISEHKSKAFLV